MKYATVLCALIIVVAASPAWAEPVPEWVKSAAGWWADGITSDAEFVAAIQHLIEIDIITIESAEQTEAEQTEAKQSGSIPEWVKSAAGWWADGITSDAEFVAAIQHLIKMGIVQVDAPGEAQSEDPRMAELQEQLEACAQYAKAYQRLDCEDGVEQQIIRLQYETEAVPYQVGPVIYYYPGAHLEMTDGGQPLLTIRILAVNDGTDNITLSCTGPAICNYDVTDGSAAYKYASTDFTSGSITIKPDYAKEFEIIFGPNIGYGGTTFVYDPAKEYHFRINETFGSASIPLDLE
ncbi:MAG: peptidase [Nitrosopumilaceae archaeon]|nr:peptidase [Nitrosopumilaceae archaeon]